MRVLDPAKGQACAHAESPAPDCKLLGLELVRFICALSVLIWHYRHFYEIEGGPAFVSIAQPLYSLLAPFYAFGQFGVEVFWGISGFIFFWKYGESVASGRVSPAKFFWLRFSRLYPLHFATLILVAILQPLYVLMNGSAFIYADNTLRSFVAQLFLVSHWFAPVTFGFNGPIWSVSAEIFAYISFFVLVRSFGPRWPMIIGPAVGSLVAQFAGLKSPVLLCTGYFFVGGIAARLFMDSQGSKKAIEQLKLSAVVFGGLGIACWWNRTLVSDETLPILLLVALPALLLIAAHDWPVLDRWQDLIRAAGNLTYSSYLIHFPLQLAAAVLCAYLGWSPPGASPIFLIGYLGLTLVLARVIFERFERPAQDIIRRAALRPVVAIA